MTETRNLHQRIIAATKALDGGVKPTGKDQFRNASLSIEDVEKSAGAALANEGVVTMWGSVELIPIQPPVDGAKWCVNLVVYLVNADDPKDKMESGWRDVGGNPMAAASFARKGFYKALLHLAEKDDEGEVKPTETRRNMPERPPVRSLSPPVSTEPALKPPAPLPPLDEILNIVPRLRERRQKATNDIMRNHGYQPEDGLVTAWLMKQDTDTQVSILADLRDLQSKVATPDPALPI